MVVKTAPIEQDSEFIDFTCIKINSTFAFTGVSVSIVQKMAQKTALIKLALALGAEIFA